MAKPAKTWFAVAQNDDNGNTEYYGPFKTIERAQGFMRLLGYKNAQCKPYIITMSTNL